MVYNSQSTNPNSHEWSCLYPLTLQVRGPVCVSVPIIWGYGSLWEGGNWKQVQGGAECECQGDKRRKSRPTWSCGVSMDGVIGHFDFNYFLLQKIRSNKLRVSKFFINHARTNCTHSKRYTDLSPISDNGRCWPEEVVPATSPPCYISSVPAARELPPCVTWEGCAFSHSQCLFRAMQYRHQQDASWVWIPSLPFVCSVTLSKSLRFSEPQLPHL